MPYQATRPPLDSWTVAIHQSSTDRKPLGTGVVIDATHVLTCAHVLQYEHGWRDEIWVAFPKAAVPRGDRRRVEHFRTDGSDCGDDLALLELAAPVPAAVTPARIRCVPAEMLYEQDWWTFGFPGRNEAGNDARGTVGAHLGYGRVRLDTHSRYPLERGFSGSGVWSPEYEAVVGLVVAAAPGAPHPGDGHALTIHQADQALPELKLSTLAEWTTDAAGGPALADWGWALRIDPESGRHWSPRGRGVSTDDEDGYRFRGRTAALTELVRWLDRPVPDGKVLVVTGSPGVGKSAVLGRVVTTADPDLRTHLPPDDRAVRARERSVACAVHAKGKTALEVAREIARAASVALPASAEDLVPALRDRLAAQPRRFNLVVDALDEAATPAQARQLAGAVLLPLAASCAEFGAQVVVGTRRADDEGDLLDAFHGRACLIDLDRPEYFAEPDLAAYATATLQAAGADRPDNPYADAAVATPVAKRIAALAGRNFLVAGLVARAYGRNDIDPVDPDKVSFTPTIDAALDACLAGLAPAGATSARLALAVLAFAEPPGLPLPLWQAGVVTLGGTVTEEELATFARQSAAKFLVETNTGPTVRAYRLFHAALGEALLRGRDATGSRVEDERRLLDAWLHHGRAIGWSATYDYLRESLPAHARRIGRVDHLLAHDRYLLHADLRRLMQVADGATTRVGRARALLLQRTPQAVGASAPERAAMFSVTEQLDRLGTGFAAAAGALYHGRWARTPPRHERTALEGHANGVLGVCAVPLDGRSLLASAGEDGTVRVWDPATGQPLRVLAGHTDWVRGTCPIPVGDRHLLASASDDGTVRLWDPATGACERVLAGHTDWVRGICAILVGGRHLLASASDDGTVRLWDPGTGQPVRVLDGHPDWVTAVCSVDVGGRQLLATAGYDPTIRLWDPGTGQLVRALEGQSGWVTALCSVDVGGRQLLATAGYDPTILLWDPGTGRLVRALEGQSGWVTALCTVDVGGRQLLAAAGHEDAIWLWDPHTGRRHRVLGSHARPITGLCTTVAGTRALLGATSEDGTVRLWDPATGACERVLAGHTDWVRGACGVPVGERSLLASAGDDGTVRLWDPGTGQPERVIDGVGPVVGLCTTPGSDATLLASTGRDGAVRLWDAGTGAPRQSLTGHTAPVTSLCTVPVEDGRQLLASASEDRTIRLWDPATGRPQRILKGDHPAVTAVCTVPGRIGAGHLLASASDTLRLWNPATGQLVRVLGHMRWVTAVCPVSVEGGHLLASADEDGVVRLWDPATGHLERELRCHHAATTALCAVPVGGRHLLASASNDHTILLWDPESGTRIWALHGHTAAVTGLCVVPYRGRHLLASTSDDRTARLWDPASGTVALSIPVYHRALACQYASGTLVLGLDTGMLAVALDDLSTALAPAGR